MLKCIIVDDEPLALELIKSYVLKTPFLKLIGAYTDAFEAIDVLQKEQVDLVFLDIQMPEITGIEFAAQIDTFKTKVVFTTAFDSYALEGFRVDAIDYLLKPISYQDFLRASKKVLRLLEPVTDVDRYLIVKTSTRLIKVDYNDILYLESMGDYVVIKLQDNSEIKTLSTLKGVESTISSPPFYRVHRSFIVNLPKVTVLERNCIVFGKKIIPISESYRDTVLNHFL